MHATLLGLWCVLLPGAAEPRTVFQQVHPRPRKSDILERSKGQKRAIVLVGGLRLADRHAAVLPALVDWQQPGTQAVKALGRDADVFAFGYSQAFGVEEVAASRGLCEDIARLKKIGYGDIVLVGHSAGGLVVRHFVEDHPAAGVTKVIQLCTPNGGSLLARAHRLAAPNLQPLIESLTREARERSLRLRRVRKLKIPDGVQFVCVVGKARFLGDGVISARTQWSEDLQELCIPARVIRTTHEDAVEDPKTFVLLRELIVKPQPRLPRHRIPALRLEISRN
jgi:hypothetical protein